jgi:hypothetical protein
MIFRKVGVEEEKRDPPDARDADEQLNRAISQLEDDRRRTAVPGARQRQGQILRVEDRVLFVLPPGGVEDLTSGSFRSLADFRTSPASTPRPPA